LKITSHTSLVPGKSQNHQNIVQNFASIGLAIHKILYQYNDSAKVFYLSWGHPFIDQYTI